MLSLGEIRRGIERLRSRDAHQAAIFEAWLDGLEESFVDRILPVDLAVAQAWGRLTRGNPSSNIDGLLAATALVHGLTVVTRDTGPFERIGIPFVDPWRAT